MNDATHSLRKGRKLTIHLNFFRGVVMPTRARIYLSYFFACFIGSAESVDIVHAVDERSPVVSLEGTNQVSQSHSHRRNQRRARRLSYTLTAYNLRVQLLHRFIFRFRWLRAVSSVATIKGIDNHLGRHPLLP